MKKRPKPFILIITGITTAGKSTLLKGLKRHGKLGKQVRFEDMDENGIPDAGRSHWRLFRVEELLHKAVRDYKRGKSTVLCGVIYPHEIINCAYFDAELNLHYLLLKNSKAIFSKRVDDRAATDPAFEYLRGHKSHFLGALKHLQNEVVTQLRHFVRDSGKLGKDKLVGNTAEIIKQIQG